ncbi:MAG: O-antigen ligase family protein [Patescibacteria group bacterium]
MLKILFWLFLISIPFGFRILLYQFTPGFHEYESIFLYASDFFLLLAVFLIFTKFRFVNFTRLSLVKLSLAVFLILAGFSVFSAGYKLLAFYNFVRLAFLAAMALAIGKLLEKGFLKLEKILAVIAGLAVVESLIGAAQFYYQKSLGLRFLGESFLGPAVKGVAKIDVEGGHFLRAYGTFPHPNILAAFLLLGLFALYYFWLNRPIKGRPFSALKQLFFGDLLIAFGLFAILLGLVLTFSRAGWLIAGLLSVAFIIYLGIDKNYRKQGLRLFMLLFAICYMLYAIFGWAIAPRVQISFGESAVSQRLTYNQLGFDLIKNHPVGIGIGNQTIFAVENNFYQNIGMNESWQWQPIHNIYLLIASEISIMGLAVFLMFIASLIFRKFKTQNSKLFNFLNLDFGIPFIMLVSLLLFGFFDHFLWTLQPGRLMFWLVIGLMI